MVKEKSFPRGNCQERPAEHNAGDSVQQSFIACRSVLFSDSESTGDGSRFRRVSVSDDGRADARSALIPRESGGCR